MDCLFAHRSVALKRRQRELRFESRDVVLPRSSCHLRSFVPAMLPEQERAFHLTHRLGFPEALQKKEFL